MGTGAGITDVVFDFCGVLVDRRVTRTLEGFYPPDQICEYFAYDDRSGFHYFEDLLDRGMGIDEVSERCEEERGWATAQMLLCSYAHADRGFTRLVPGIGRLLVDLVGAGVRLWGVTNMPEATFHRMYARFPQLRRSLSGVVVSGAAKVAKPDERIFRLAAERFGLDAPHALFVDDNTINVAAAERTGMQGLAFIDEPRLRESLRLRGIDIPRENAQDEQMEETIMLMNHDGASACSTTQDIDHDIELTPDNGGARGAWRAVRIGSMGLPAGTGDFWAERCREYRALQWNQMDWGFVREQLERVASQLGSVSCEAPEIVIPGGTARERTFLEMWFGYGDACCSARLRGGRLEVGCGQHRVLAVANRAIASEDARLLGLSGTAFSAGEPLPADTMLPIFVQE